ncbi:MAG: hypothetical protein AMXMBFR53_19680 [Gemmatimonadota bacterium]
MLAAQSQEGSALPTFGEKRRIAARDVVTGLLDHSHEFYLSAVPEFEVPVHQPVRMETTVLGDESQTSETRGGRVQVSYCHDDVIEAYQGTRDSSEGLLSGEGSARQAEREKYCGLWVHRSLR